jgi:hypothetical protein
VGLQFVSLSESSETRLISVALAIIFLLSQSRLESSHVAEAQRHTEKPLVLVIFTCLDLQIRQLYCRFQVVIAVGIRHGKISSGFKGKLGQ